MKKYYLALDLKEDDSLISAYDEYHKNVWPEVKESLKMAGILDMEIYRTGNRLFMMIHVSPEFSFENKAALDKSNPIVQDWETRMSQYQQQLPGSLPGEKWKIMERVFKLQQENK